MSDVNQTQKEYLKVGPGKDVTGDAFNTPLQNSLKVPNAPVINSDNDLNKFQVKANSKTGKIDIYEYQTAIDGNTVTQINKYEAKDGFTAETFLKEKIGKEAAQKAGLFGQNTDGLQALAPGYVGVVDAANDTVGALKKVGQTAYDGSKEEDREAYDELQKKLAKSNADYEASFRDRVSSFSAQTFFLENLRPFVEYAKTSNPKGYGDAAFGSNYGLKLLSTRNPELLLHMAQSERSKNIIAFQNGTPEMFSALIPQLQIFYVYPDGSEAQIPFSTFTEELSGGDPTKMLMSREGRGDDVGLLSFDWSYEGGEAGAYFYAAGGAVGTATLSLYFQSASSLTKKRKVLASATSGNSKLVSKTFTYDQLLTKDLKDHRDREIRDLKQGRIRAVAKYGVDKAIAKSMPNSAEFFTAASQISVGLDLHPGEYELEFEESGGLTLNIEYQISVELDYSDPKLNIFGSDLTADLTAIVEEIEGIKRSKATAEEDSQIEDAPNIEEKNKLSKVDKHDAILELLNQDFTVAQNEVYGSLKGLIMRKVHKISKSRGDLENYITLRQVTPSERKNVTSTVESQGGTYLWDSSKEIKTSEMSRANFDEIDLLSPHERFTNSFLLEDNTEVDLYWVYIGDILASILEQKNLRNIMQDKNMVFILGQAVLPNGLEGVDGVDPAKPVLVNIADIPISLYVWNQFFANEIVKRKIVNLDLFGFLRLFASHIIYPMLNSHDVNGSKDVLRTTRLEPFFYSGNASRINKMFSDSNRKMFNNITDIDFGRQISPNPLKKSNKSNIFLIMGGFDGSNLGPIDGASGWAGNEDLDRKYGIMHYYLSRDRGFLKSASFKKSPIKFLRELNVAASMNQSTSVRPVTFLWNPMSIDMELFGNPNIFFNSVFFVQPTLPGISGFQNKNSPAYKLQIGGYHQVNSISNTIDPNGWSTAIEGTRLEPVSGKYASPQAKASLDKIYPQEVFS